MATTSEETVKLAARRVADARAHLMAWQPWYAHIAVQMIWIPSAATTTMGVRITADGQVQCVYSPPFVLGQGVKPLSVVVQHEIEHIIRQHCVRIHGRQPRRWNLACDMCVNGSQSSPRIGYVDRTTGRRVLPAGGNLVWIPDNWPVDRTAEYYYERLADDTLPHAAAGNEGDPFGSGTPEGSGGSAAGDDLWLDDHSLWLDPEVGYEEAAAIVASYVKAANEQAPGDVPGHVAALVRQPAKPSVRWNDLLRRFIVSHAGGRRPTYCRPNRRYPKAGLPGTTRHSMPAVNIVLDTSGSINQRTLQRFFAEIEAITRCSRTNILQFDCAFQGFSAYRRGDWKGFQVRGRGGTDMAAAVDWLVDRKQLADVQVMLTDGWTDWPRKRGFPMIFVITNPRGTVTEPTWGKVLYMDADD